MKTIWKFELPTSGNVDIPKDYEVLEVAAQGGNLCLWALVDPEAERVSRSFPIYGTGHQIKNSKDLVHIGTAHFEKQALVFHVFEDHQNQ